MPAAEQTSVASAKWRSAWTRGVEKSQEQAKRSDAGREDPPGPARSEKLWGWLMATVFQEASEADCQ